MRESDVCKPNADSEHDRRVEPCPADKICRAEDVFTEGISVRQATWIEESSDVGGDSLFDPCSNDYDEADYFDVSPSDNSFNDLY